MMMKSMRACFRQKMRGLDPIPGNLNRGLAYSLSEPEDVTDIVN